MHMWNNFGDLYNTSLFGPGFFVLIPVIFSVLAIWSLFWKGLALWHSSRRGEKWWFIVLLLINTLGILEIIYLFGVAKLKFDELFSFGKKN